METQKTERATFVSTAGHNQLGQKVAAIHHFEIDIGLWILSRPAAYEYALVRKTFNI